MISSIDAFRCTQVVKDKKSWFFCAILAMWPYIVVLHITRLECRIPRKPPVWRDLWFIQLGSSQVGWEGWNRLSYTYILKKFEDSGTFQKFVWEPTKKYIITLEHIVSTWFWRISKCKLICVKYSLGQTWGYFGCGPLPVTVTSKMKLHVFGGCIQDNRSKAVWWRIHAPVWSLRLAISVFHLMRHTSLMKQWKSGDPPNVDRIQDFAGSGIRLRVSYE